MAEKRMYTTKITDSEEFYSMPASSQALYFHLCQGADDDGFNNQVSLAMFKAHASATDLEVLYSKRYILGFDNGIIIIKHWRMHNYIRKDTYKPTAYTELLKTLNIKENGAYSIAQIELRDEPVTNPLQVRDEPVTQIRLDKNRLDKDSVVKRFTPPTLDEVKEYIQEKGYHVDPERFINYYESNGWMVGRNKMKDWKAAVRNWESKDKPQQSNFSKEY